MKCSFENPAENYSAKNLKNFVQNPTKMKTPYIFHRLSVFLDWSYGHVNAVLTFLRSSSGRKWKILHSMSEKDKKNYNFFRKKRFFLEMFPWNHKSSFGNPAEDFSTKSWTFLLNVRIFIDKWTFFKKSFFAQNVPMDK